MAADFDESSERESQRPELIKLRQILTLLVLLPPEIQVLDFDVDSFLQNGNLQLTVDYKGLTQDEALSILQLIFGDLLNDLTVGTSEGSL